MSRMSIYALMLAAGAAIAAPASAQQIQVALGEPVSVETLAMAIAFERAKEKGVTLPDEPPARGILVGWSARLTATRGGAPTFDERRCRRVGPSNPRCPGGRITPWLFLS